MLLRIYNECRMLIMDRREGYCIKSMLQILAYLYTKLCETYIAIN
jgi:hypothetical protein